MPDETPAPETGAPETPDEGEKPSPETPDDVGGLKSALEKEREARKNAEKQAKEAGKLAAKLKEYEDRDKTETEKQAEAIKALTNERDEAAASLLRYQVAAEKALDPELVEFLPSGTREEMEAAADKMLAKLGDITKPRTPAPTSTQGKSGQPSAPTPADEFADFLANKL